MKAFVIAAVAAAGLAATGVASAQEDLAKSSGCLNCHAVDTKKVGPAFKDVATKLKGKSDAEILADIKAQKPHGSSKASDADIAAIGKWIASL